MLWSGEMLLSRNVTVGPRVELQLYEGASLREYRELREFARFCIDRIERDVGRASRWTVKIGPNGVCFSCELIVEHRGLVVRADGNGFDGAVAGRDAFCKIEKLLRDHGALLDLGKQEVAGAAR